MVECPICGEAGATPWRVMDDYAYLECGRCDSIFIDPVVIAEIDAGASIVDDSGDCLERERSAAHERSFGGSLARMTEALRDARRSVRSERGAIYIFDTGLPEYVKGEDPGYMDPKRRGHIVSYGRKGMAHIAASLGFACLPIVGKPWAFCLEYLPEEGQPPLQPRIGSRRPENRALLHDREMGSALYVLALETARAYG